MNNLFERFVINYYGDLPEILKKIDVHVQHNGLMLCPMHDNYDTPAAKIFKDDTGWCFWCFNEQRMYGTYDIYKNVFHYNMKSVFNYLWSNLTQAQQDMMKDRFGEYDETTEIPNESSFVKFSRKQISYKQLLNEIEFSLK